MITSASVQVLGYSCFAIAGAHLTDQLAAAINFQSIAVMPHFDASR